MSTRKFSPPLAAPPFRLNPVLLRYEVVTDLAAALHALSGRRELEGCYFSDREYFYIALPPTPAEYLASRSRVFRKGVSRILRRAAAEGLTMNELTPADLPPERLVELFLSL